MNVHMLALKAAQVIYGANHYSVTLEIKFSSCTT